MEEFFAALVVVADRDIVVSVVTAVVIKVLLSVVGRNRAGED